MRPWMMDERLWESSWKCLSRGEKSVLATKVSGPAVRGRRQQQAPGRSSRTAMANEMEIHAGGRQARSSQSKRGRNSRKYCRRESLGFSFMMTMCAVRTSACASLGIAPLLSTARRRLLPRLLPSPPKYAVMRPSRHVDRQYFPAYFLHRMMLI